VNFSLLTSAFPAIFGTTQYVRRRQGEGGGDACASLCAPVFNDVQGE